MNSELPPVSGPSAAGSTPKPVAAPAVLTTTPPPAPKRHNWLLLGCGGLIALLLVAILSVVLTIWWVNRPIRPVVLSENEKQVVEQKLNRLDAAPTGRAHNF